MTASYERAEKDDQYTVEVTKEKPIQPEKAAVSSITPGRRPTVKAPEVEAKPPSKGLIGKIVSIFAGDKEESKEEEKEPERPQRSSRSRSQRNGSSRSRGSRGRGRSSRGRSRKQDTAQDSSKAGKQA